MLSREEIARPLHSSAITHFHVWNLHWTPVERIVWMTWHRRQKAAIFTAFLKVIYNEILILNQIKILVPLVRRVETIGVMMNLSATRRDITVVLEVVRKRNQIWIRRSPPVTIAIQTRC